MKDLKLTIRIFFIVVLIALLLGRIDYETESFSQILFTRDGQFFLLSYGFIFTSLAWIFIGFKRLMNSLTSS